MSLFVRQLRRQKMLRKMARMRAAKERKRLANPVEREPKMVRWFPLELGVRDKRTKEIVWTDFRSVRDAAKRLAVVQRFYQ
jgi:hypothetical protein